MRGDRLWIKSFYRSTLLEIKASLLPFCTVKSLCKNTRLSSPVDVLLHIAEPENPAGILQYFPSASIAVNSSSSSSSSTNSSSNNGTSSIFASLFSSAGPTAAPQATSFSDLMGCMSRTDRPVTAEPPSLCLATNGPVPFFSQPAHDRRQFAPHPSPSAHMSATALLQKAAQMGATASSNSFLRDFGLATTSSSSGGPQDGFEENGLQWRHHHQRPLEPEPPILSARLGLGLPYESGSVRPDLMMGPSSLFGPKPSATLDFMGLGMGPGGSATGGLSALITSIGGGIDMGAAAAAAAAAPAGPFGGGGSPGRAWEAQERKPSSPAIL